MASKARIAQKKTAKRSKNAPPRGEASDAAVVAALRILPPKLRNADVARLLGQVMVNPELKRNFRANPREFFVACNVNIPNTTKIDVVETNQDTYVVVIPNEAMGPLESTGPDELREGQRVKLTDEELVSQGAELAHSTDDWTDPNWYNLDNKRDVKWGFQRDGDPNTADSTRKPAGDKGRDTPADT